MKNFEVYNKNNYQWQFPVLLALILAFIDIIIRGEINTIDLIQIFIFFALLWYSFETRDLKKSTQESNDIELRPIVDLYYRPPTANSHGEYFRLRNSGKGVAYNIFVEPIIIDIGIDDNKYIFNFCIKDTNLMLAPLGDEKTINITCETISSNNSSSISDINALKLFKNLVLAKRVADLQGVEFIILFENANKKKIKRIFNFFYDNTNYVYRVNFEK